MRTTFTITVTVEGDSSREALEALSDLLDHADCVQAYTTETYTDENGEEQDTAHLMGGD